MGVGLSAESKLANLQFTRVPNFLSTANYLLNMPNISNLTPSQHKSGVSPTILGHQTGGPGTMKFGTIKNYNSVLEPSAYLNTQRSSYKMIFINDHCREEQVEDVMISLDAMKAFDSVAMDI